jgi:predicted phosphodiesterase
MKTVVAWLLVLVVVSMIVLPHSFVYAKSKDSKAKDAIIKAIGKAVEGKYSTIKLIQLSKSNVTGYVVVYNTTKTTPSPPTPVPPNPSPPLPPSSQNTTRIALIGDVSGTSVRDVIKKQMPDLVVALGDLGYKSDLSSFKKDWGGSFKNLRCDSGNHDSKEDGSASLEAETLAYCGDHWSQPVGKATLIIGLNTNGDVNTQVNYVKSLPLSNYKTIIITSHKAGHVPPNSHHPAEAATLYKQLEALIPSTTKLWEIVGHNHVSSSAPSKNWYQAGSGGKSFYSCGQDAVWTYCDNKVPQYLELTISNSDGTTAAKFVK